MTPTLTTALRAARRAGNLMLRAANNLEHISTEQKAANDFVTEIDKEAETILIESVLTAYPHHLIQSEEGGFFRAEKKDGAVQIIALDPAQVAPKNEYIWIIDPLDGTTNFLHGHPQYAISMALQHKGQIQEALIFAPEKNDLYTATRGGGAYCNEKRLRVSKRSRLNESLIGTGFPVVNHSVTDTYLAILKEILEKTAGARREGSAALDLCATAAGRFDAFFEFNLKPWDIAAGALIVQESGGLITDFDGEQAWLKSGNICAGNAKVLAQILQIIQSHR